MKLKNLITIGAVAGLLLSSSPIGLIAPSVLAAEAASTAVRSNNTQEFRYDFEKGLGYAAVSMPKTAIKGESFRAGLIYDWATPDTTNVLQVLLTLDKDVNATLTGVEGMVKSDYSLSDDGKRLSIIMDDAKIKEGLYGVVQSDIEETVTMHVSIEYANIDDDGEIVENLVKKDLSINVIDGKVLEDAKTAAKETISKLPNLSATEKADYNAEVDGSSSVEMVNDVVNNAKTKDAQNLADKKAKASAIINGLDYLSVTEKESFLTELPSSATLEQVDLVIQLAQEKNDSNRIAQELNDAKTAAKAEIAALPNLSEAEKATYNTQVDAAKTTAAITTIVNNAKAKDNENLASAKAIATTTINQLPNLSDGEKTEFLSQITNATTIVEVDSIVAAAKAKDAKNLQDAKDKAKEDIDNNPNISEEEKEEKKEEIDEKETIEDVEKVAEDAEKEGQQNLKDAQTAGKEAINQLPNLSEEEKADFNNRVDGSTTTEDINKIVEEAKVKDAQNLKDAQTAGKEAINQLPNLSADEKNGFVNQVDGSTTIADMNKVIEKAKEKDAQNLKDAQAAGKEAINKLPNLTEDEKNGFVNQVDSSTTIDNVNKVVADAAAKDAQNLQDAKDKAKEDVNNLPDLTDKEKEDANKEIDEATTIPEIEKIVKDATEKNEMNAVKQGDLNNDRNISVLDLALLKRYLHDDFIPSSLEKEKFKKAADVNKDGRTSLVDLAALKIMINKG